MYMKKYFLRVVSTTICLVIVITLVGCKDQKTKVSLVDNPSLSLCDYKLGDLIANHSLTDVNGNTYKFSEIFKEKEAIVLNFWFINCGPCQMEFPYLQAASDAYDDVMVFAINPTDDKPKDIQKYAVQNNLSLPMIKGEQDWITAFSLQGFPTTVVIDRYGKIAFSHMGAVTEDGVFEKIFEFFVNEDYEHTTIKNISEIK